MKKIIFKNEIHELNYLIQIQLIPVQLQDNAEIQAVIYFVSLIVSESHVEAKYIFRFVKQSLPVGFFDNPDHKEVAKALALRFWETTYLTLEEEWGIYFLAAEELGFFEILKCDKLEYLNYLLCAFKNLGLKKKHNIFEEN